MKKKSKSRIISKSIILHEKYEVNAIDDDDYDVVNGSDVDGVSSVELEAMIDMSVVANEHESEMYIYSFFT